jgi:hypothetical protein
LIERQNEFFANLHNSLARVGKKLLVCAKHISEHDQFVNMRLCAKFQLNIFKTERARPKTDFLKKTATGTLRMRKMKIRKLAKRLLKRPLRTSWMPRKKKKIESINQHLRYKVIFALNQSIISIYIFLLLCMSMLITIPSIMQIRQSVDFWRSLTLTVFCQLWGALTPPILIFSQNDFGRVLLFFKLNIFHKMFSLIREHFFYVQVRLT